MSLLAIAAVAIIGFGNELVIDEGWSDLHIDPLQFLSDTAQAWYPNVFLGTHSGFTIIFQTPYSWCYALLTILHVPAVAAQRIVIFGIYLLAAACMYVGVGNIFPQLSRFGRISAASAFVFNMYVAFNSQGGSVMLVTYATMPALVGTALRSLDDGRAIRHGIIAGLLVFIGGGFNPPLVVMNAAVVAICVVIRLVLSPRFKVESLRALRFAAFSCIAALLLNAYWMVPFIDYIHTTWLGGILDESPAQHNASSSFANVFVGLSQWATFSGDSDGPWYPWAKAYDGGIFRFLIASIAALSITAVALQRTRRAVSAAILAVLVVSIMFAVGYYQGDGGTITTPIYDFFYRFVPGFQMFRATYKWVGPMEFAFACLFGMFAFRAQIWLRALKLKSWRRALEICALVAIVSLPCLGYVPVLLNKANFPGVTLPAWVRTERRLVPPDPDFRTALFPSQFFEKFAWGKPTYPIEYGEIQGPLIMGYLGSSTSQPSDEWIKLAYRLAREGDPKARSAFRVLGIDRILERDDLRQDLDFSLTGDNVGTDSTLAHDIITRVIGAQFVKRSGPLFSYAIPHSIPLFRGIAHPLLGAGPALSVPDGLDYGTLPSNEAVVSADGLDPAILGGKYFVIGREQSFLDDLATTLAKSDGVFVDAQTPNVAFNIDTAGSYRLSVGTLSHNDGVPLSIVVDGVTRTLPQSDGAWSSLRALHLEKGAHSVTLPSATLLAPELFSVLRTEKWLRVREAIASLPAEADRGDYGSVAASRSSVVIKVDRSGTYALTGRTMRADPLVPVQRKVRLQSRPARFPDLPSNLIGSVPVPFLPLAGTASAPYGELPTAWFANPDIYDWNRNTAAYWILLTRHSQFGVFVPARRVVTISLRMRISNLASGQTMKIYVNGKPQASFDLPAGPVPSRPESLAIAERVDEPTVFSASLRLPGGYDDVTLESNASSPTTGGIGIVGSNADAAYVAAVYPDVSFEAMSGSLAGGLPMLDPSSARKAPGFGAVPIAIANERLSGDPFLNGVVSGGSSRSVAIAELVGPSSDSSGPIIYRLAPVADGSFDCPLARALPSVSTDSNTRILSAWLLTSPSNYPRANPALSNAVLQRSLPADLPSNLLSIVRIGREPGVRLVRRTFTGSLKMQLAAGSYRISAMIPDEVVRQVTWVDGAAKPRLIDVIPTRLSATHIIVRFPHPSGPFVLRFGESYHPEWRATMGSRPLTHVYVDGYANGWLVPGVRANDQIELVFTAASMYAVTKAVSGLSLCGALLGLGFLRRKRSHVGAAG